jgi:hypothetical protein
MQSTHYSYPILKKTEFSSQIFEKYSNIKFHENLSIGAEMLHADRRIDRHDEGNSRFLQFCERA